MVVETFSPEETEALGKNWEEKQSRVRSIP